MGAGTASVGTFQKKDPGSSFVTGAAVNGLSINAAGKVVLGNDAGGSAALLLSNREIPMGAKSLSLINGTVNFGVLFTGSTNVNILGDWSFDNNAGTNFFSTPGTGQLTTNAGGVFMTLGSANAILNCQSGGGEIRLQITASNKLVINNAGNVLIGTAVGTGAKLEVTGAIAIKTVGDGVLMHTGTALTNFAGANVVTVNNGPLAGNPSKWIAVDDNGTNRFIPCW